MSPELQDFFGVAPFPTVVVVALLSSGAGSLLLRRLLPRVLARACLVLSLTGAGAAVLWVLFPTGGGFIQEVARCGALLSLAWILVATLAAQARRPSDPAPIRSIDFVGSARIAALLLGVLTGVIQAVILTIRAICVVLDHFSAEPDLTTRSFGFTSVGLASLIALTASSAIGWLSTRDRRVGLCLLWSAVLVSAWWSLLGPAVRGNGAGGFDRTGVLLVLLAALSALLLCVVLAAASIERRARQSALTVGGGAPPADTPHRPGFSQSVAVIAILVLILVCYHLLVPVPITPGGVRAGIAVVTVSAAAAAVACFVQLLRGWSGTLADAAMGLTSMFFCAAASLFVPRQPEALAERFPMIFNAVMMGLALATATCAWVVSTLRHRVDRGLEWPTAARLIPSAERFTFFNASLALVVGAVMAVWPRWPGIATTDDTLGRVAAGLSANLLLLLVLLWCSRRLRRFVFQVLAVLSVVSGAGFLLARMLPFTPQFV